MKELRYTLLPDGSSDQALLPILTWVLRQHHVELAIQPQWADLSRMPRKRRSLAEKIETSLSLYPCDLLFIHRDAERESYEKRVAEIETAIGKATTLGQNPVICVVPVRMQEAWLLFDETALRIAAGNQNGRQQLQLPPLIRLEQQPDPKSVLYELLREASGLRGLRRRKFAVRAAARRVAEFIDDFSPLRTLLAFQALETEIEAVVKIQGWNLTPKV